MLRLHRSLQRLRRPAVGYGYRTTQPRPLQSWLSKQPPTIIPWRALLDNKSCKRDVFIKLRRFPYVASRGMLADSGEEAMVLTLSQLEQARHLEEELERLRYIAERERFAMLAYMISVALGEAKEILKTARPT